jgi:hypothetical protein
VCKGRACRGWRASDIACCENVGANDFAEEAPALAFLCRHGTTGVEELGRAPLADQAWQHRAGAHVAAGKADAREKERGLRLGRGEAGPTPWR